MRLFLTHVIEFWPHKSRAVEGISKVYVAIKSRVCADCLTSLPGQ